MVRILVVEDEPALAQMIAMNLKHNGYTYQLAEDANTALQAVQTQLPDLILLDWMLPGQSGLALAKQWRSQTRTRDIPIIMLTARDDERDKVKGLDSGADDYMVKPFSLQELLARIRALLRRKSPQLTEEDLSLNGLSIDPANRLVTYLGQMIKIGPTEFKLLYYFMRHPHRIHSRALLLDKIWGDHVYIEERTVDVHIKRLREALQPVGASHLIETVRGVGYRFQSKSSL